jgi:chromate reductase, NAD(P)H dehydrogenase (quinone)
MVKNYTVHFLRQIVVFLNTYPINRPEVIVTFAQDKFDENGRVVKFSTC